MDFNRLDDSQQDKEYNEDDQDLYDSGDVWHGVRFGENPNKWRPVSPRKMKQIRKKQEIEEILRRRNLTDVQRPVLTRPWKTNIDDWEKENAQTQIASHCDESSNSNAEQLKTDSQISSNEVVTGKQEIETVHNEADIISHENSSWQERMIEFEEMLEEWNSRKNKAEDEIATIHDRIKEANRLNENVVERLNTSLAKCSDELAAAKEELAIEREKNADERHHFQLRLNAFEAENTERLRMEVDSLKELLDAAQNEHKQLSDKNALLREEVVQYKDALQATDEHYKESLKERERKVTDLEQNLKHSEQLSGEISQELAKSNTNLDQVKKSNESLTEELKATKDKISELEAQTAQLTSQIENDKAENACLKDRVRELSSKNNEWTQDNKETFTLKIDILKAQLSNAQKEAKDLSDANTLLQKQVKQYRGRFNRRDAQLKKLETEHTSLLNTRRKVERDLSIKREEFEHLREQVARYRDTLKQRESKIVELDENVKQSEHIRSCLSEELAKSNSMIQSTIVELERQKCENEKCTSVWKEQRNADQTRIRILESKLAQYKSIFSLAIDIDEELNETEPVFQAESMGQSTNSSEYKARKRHSLDNDQEDQDLRDSIKKPHFSPLPPDDLSRLPTPSNCEAALSTHGENDTTLPLLHLPMPAHEDVAMSDVGANGEITARDESSNSNAEQLKTDSQISSNEVVTGKQEIETVHNEADIISHENSSWQERMIEFEEMLEEWNSRKNKAEDEIATIHDRIKEANRLNENVVERLNTSLAKCSDELAAAKEELAIEREKNADERHHFQLRLNAFEAENTERLRMEVDSLKELLDAAQNEHKQLSDKNALLREEVVQYKDALQATDEHYKESLKERERKVTDLEQNLKHSEQLSGEISQELAKSNTNLDQVKKSNESLTEELKATKDKISELEAQTAQLTSQIENDKAENACLKDRVRELSSKNNEWTQDNKETFTLKIDILKAQLSNAQKEAKDLSDANTLLQKQVKQYRGRFNRRDAQLKKLETEHTSLLNTRRKVERDLSIKREEFEHLREQVARYRDTLKQRESKIVELDENVKQSEHIRSCLSEELAKSNSMIQSTIVELERQKCENEKCTSVWKEQRNADQTRIRILESKLAQYKSIFSLAIDIDEELNETEPVFQAESMGQSTNSSEYKARKRHSLDNDQEDQDLRDSIKKPHFSPLPPDDLSRLPTPSNCEAALSTHGENDTTLPLLHLPMPAHEDVAMSDVGANGEITARVDISNIPMPADLSKRKTRTTEERKEKESTEKKVIGRERSTESIGKTCD